MSPSGGRPGDIVATDAYAIDAQEARLLFESMSTRELLTLQVSFESTLRMIDDPRLVVFAAGRLALINIVIKARNPQPAPIELFAWIGEDEFGSGVVGLKQEMVLAGTSPLVCIALHRDRLQNADTVAGMQAQADHYGKRIRFARFTIVEDLIAVERRQ